MVDFLYQPSNFLIFSLLSDTSLSFCSSFWNIFLFLFLFLSVEFIDYAMFFSRVGFKFFSLYHVLFFVDTLFSSVFHSMLKRSYFEYSPCRDSVPFKLSFSIYFGLFHFLGICQMSSAPWLFVPLDHMIYSSSKISVQPSQVMVAYQA